MLTGAEPLCLATTFPGSDQRGSGFSPQGRELKVHSGRAATALAFIGGVLGTAIGILFALLVTSSLDDLELGFGAPLRQLAIFLILALVSPTVVPARRARVCRSLEALRAE